jgi:hypothetical protein
MWCTETCWRTGNVWIIHFVHVTLVVQTNSSSDARNVQKNALPCLKPEYQKMITEAQQCILYDVSWIQLTFSRIIYWRLILALFSHLWIDAQRDPLLQVIFLKFRSCLSPSLSSPVMLYRYSYVYGSSRNWMMEEGTGHAFMYVIISTRWISRLICFKVSGVK